MKKILALVLMLALSVCAFSSTAEEPAPMTREQFDQAEIEDEVCVEAYVQASQSWWEGTMTLYLQNQEGGYYAYKVQMEEDEAAKLVPGTKVRITGYKVRWPEVDGEVEIYDARFEILDDEPWLAEAADVTMLMGTDALMDHMNEKIAVKGAEVAASYPKDATGQEDKSTAYPFLYTKDGGREANSDLTFNVKVNGQEFTFYVESDLCGSETEVYKAVEALQIGDVIECEGFLYWYYGANPHITSVTVK